MFLAPKGLIVDSMPTLSQEFIYELLKKLLLVVFSVNGVEEGYPQNFRHTDDNEQPWRLPCTPFPQERMRAILFCFRDLSEYENWPPSK